MFNVLSMVTIYVHDPLSRNGRIAQDVIVVVDIKIANHSLVDNEGQFGES